MFTKSKNVSLFANISFQMSSWSSPEAYGNLKTEAKAHPIDLSKRSRLAIPWLIEIVRRTEKMCRHGRCGSRLVSRSRNKRRVQNLHRTLWHLAHSLY